MPNNNRSPFHPRGEWNRTTIYSPDDIVIHEGSSWVAIIENIGTEPTWYSSEWMLLAEKGEPGSTLNPRGAWEMTTIYERGDVVSYNGSSWVALRHNIGTRPEEGDDWMLLAARGQAGVGTSGVDGEPGPPGLPGSGTNLHEDLTDVTPNQHHAQSHTMAQHTDGPYGGSGATIEVEDEGAAQGPVDTLDFVGDGVAASVAANVGTIVINRNVFVQNAAPVTSEPTYLWVQTGLGVSGTDFTMWIEDSIP